MIRSLTSLQYQCRPVCSSYINLTQKRTSFYNKYRHGPQKISNPTPDYLDWIRRSLTREGWEFLKGEVNRTVRKPFRRHMKNRREFNKTYIFEHFDTDESVKQWKPVADSDSLNGFSVSSLVRSPAGHGLFRGVLDNRLPDDGLTMKSGFAGVIGPRKERDSIASTEEFWDWSEFNAIEIKFRGDGRRYHLIVNTGTYDTDLYYYDHYGFPLHTRGGPYWQTYRIPLSKFVFCYKGFIQDIQGKFKSHSVKFVALVLQDTYDGPFQLEVDYIGLRQEDSSFSEHTAFELYDHPSIKMKLVGVDCPVPETA